MHGIVTGAARGIGRAIVFRLARDAMARSGRPANLLLVDVRAEQLDEVATMVRAEGHAVETMSADLAKAEAPAAIIARMTEKFGALDLLVSNAGIVIPGDLKDLSPDDYDKTFAVNTKATWLLAVAAYPMLKQSRGNIVATASVSATEPTARLGAYSASKAALLILMRQLADEWGPDGIRCNCVSPGAVHTPLTHNVYGNPEIRDRRAQSISLRRVAQPEDIASAVSYLAGPDAAYVTGANLVVDGGMTSAFMSMSRGDVKL